MAKRAEKADGSLPHKGVSAGRMKGLAITLLLLEGAALGLKAWEERQSADLATLDALRREALALSERVSGQVNTATAAIETARRFGGSSTNALTAAPFVEAATSLERSTRASSDERTKAAGAAAAAFAVDGAKFGVSQTGDLVVLVDAPGGSIVAYGRVERWLRPPAGRRLFSVHAAEAAHLGQVDLHRYVDKPSAGAAFTAGPEFSRAATACAPIDQSNAIACSTVAAPWINAADVSRLVIYALLLAAPALAIFGLFGALSSRRHEAQGARQSQDGAHHMFDLVMDGANAGYWEWRLGTDGAKISNRFAELLGLETGGMVARAHFEELVFPDDRPAVKAAFDEGFDNGVFETVFRSKRSNGKTWIELRGRLTDASSAETPHYAGIAMDVSDKKITEERLKAAERRLRGAVETFSGPIALWDKRRRLLFWNAAFADVFQISDVLRPGVSYDSVMVARAVQIREERPSDSDSMAILLHLASGRWLQMVERPTPDGGQITLGVDVTENIEATDALAKQKDALRNIVRRLEVSEGRAAELARKYDEEKTRAENAARAKSAFLANMSHELRTPLNAINGFSEILASELYCRLGSPKYIEYAKDIHVAGGHLLDMINDILDMSKIEAGKMSIDPRPIDPVDPVDAAIRIVRRKAEEKGINLALVSDEDLGRIEADHRAMRQMVLNLVSNAIKFTEAGGHIEVGVRRDGDRIKISVADDGVGISKENLPRLAKPFEQVRHGDSRDHQGTGLGLALTKSFAEMHGGELTIESDLGVGTTVSIYLPAGEAPPQIARAVA